MSWCSETVYEISGWSDTFETAKSREYKVLTWIACPVSFNSTGYQNLLDSFDDTSIAERVYGCWVALCQLAAQSQTRGVLSGSKGEPYSVGRIARLTGMSADGFKLLLDWAVNEGWIVPHSPATDSPSPDQVPATDPPSPDQVPATDPPSPDQVQTETKSGPLPNLTLPNPKPDPDPERSEWSDEESGIADDMPETVVEAIKAARSAFDESLLFEATLKWNHRIHRWFEFARAPRWKLKLGFEGAAEYVQAAALYALEHGDNPPALFQHIVTQSKWDQCRPHLAKGAERAELARNGVQRSVDQAG